jgi:teichuronic acid biosynthesis glycosyltransferase TuaC
MRVLFVHRRDKKLKNFQNHLIHNQGNSVQENITSIQIDYFIILGESAFAYLKNAARFRRTIKNGNYDLIHAHYYLSGFFAAFFSAKPLVVSFMGSDIHSSKLIRFLIMIVMRWRIDWAIVKSPSMKKLLNVKNCSVIPNGINLDKFNEIDKVTARKHVGFELDKKYGVFSESNVPVKNFKLVKEVMIELDDPNIEIFELNNIPHGEIIYYLNASDFLILTSLHEGSPNIIKEAMACNCPIISTDVGDVKEIISGTKKCYIVQYDKQDIAKMIRRITSDNNRTNGREKMYGLSETIISKKLITVYQEVLARNKPTLNMDIINSI